VPDPRQLCWGLHAHDNALRATMPERPGATLTVGETREATSRRRAQLPQQQPVWGAAARSPAERPCGSCRATRRGGARHRLLTYARTIVRVRQLPGPNRSPTVTRVRQHVGPFPRDLSAALEVPGPPYRQTLPVRRLSYRKIGVV
jgi:hypothetical protein